MTIYADEDFYKSRYLEGKTAVITAAFPYFAREASQIIRQYTFRVDEDNIPDEVRMCCCELAECVSERDSQLNASGGLSSESVGGWSRSYSSADSINAAFGSRARVVIYKWLGGTGLLYRG